MDSFDWHDNNSAGAGFDTDPFMLLPETTTTTTAMMFCDEMDPSLDSPALLTSPSEWPTVDAPAPQPQQSTPLSPSPVPSTVVSVADTPPSPAAVTKKPVKAQGNLDAEEDDAPEELEVDTATLLPKGLPLPAILGGPMPAVPKRRRRRKDPLPGEENAEEEEDEDSSERLEVRLPRKTLLAVSSGQMSAFVRNLRETRRLSKGQEKELKRQKRLVKNRESAANSRRKKVDHVALLDERIAKLEEENRRLKEENERLQSVAASSSKMLSASAAAPQASSFLLEDPSAAVAATGGASSSFNRSIRVAGFCLLVVLFSFGVVYNATRAPDSLNTLKLFKREAIPQVEPLASAKPFAYMPMTNSFQRFQNWANRFPQTPAAAPPSQQQQRKLMGEYDTAKAAVGQFAAGAEFSDVAASHSLAAVAGEVTTSAGVRQFAGVIISDRNKTSRGWKPKNQTYLIVTEASRADPPTAQDTATPMSVDGQDGVTPAVARPPNTIGIILPLSSLQTCDDDPDGEGVNDGSLVELTCSVLEVSRLPKDLSDPAQDSNNHIPPN